MTMNEMNKIFTEAMCIFFHTPNHKYDRPMVGIGFSNRELPVKANDFLKLLDNSFILNIDFDITKIRVTVLEEESNNVVFDTKLNFDKIEFEKFKDGVSNGCIGAFVMGVFENCRYYTVDNEDNDLIFLCRINYNILK